MKAGEVGEVLHRGEFVVEHGRVAHVGDAAALLVRAPPKTVTLPRVGVMSPRRCAGAWICLRRFRRG